MSKPKKTAKEPTRNDHFSSSEVDDLREFFKVTAGSTYPRKTLERRLKLLTESELSRFLALWEKVEKIADKMDFIIDSRVGKTPGERWP